MKITIIIVAGWLTASLMGCSTTQPGSVSTAADLAAIAAFNKHYLQAINDGDIDSLESLTTEDHIMIASSRSPLVGKTANIEAMRGAFELFNFDETWTPVETVIEGNLAYQRGTFTVNAAPKSGGETRTVTGNFLRIYKRQIDGDWRMVRDMFNSDQPSQ